MMYNGSKQTQAAYQNEQLGKYIWSLEHLLLNSLAIDPFISLQSFKLSTALPTFNPGPLGAPESPPQWQMYMPPEPGWLQKLIPGSKTRYAQKMAEAQKVYQAHIHVHATREANRKQALAKMRADYDRWIVSEQHRITTQNAEIDAFERDLRAGVPQAVARYCTIVLTSSAYPDTFPRNVKLDYTPTSKQLLVEYDLPAFEVVPGVNTYRYIKTRE